MRKDVTVHVELLRGETIVIASIQNLSLGGAFLLHPDDEVEVGERVRLYLAAGKLDAVQDARIVRVSRGAPRGFAVAWHEPGARARKVLERLLADNPEVDYPTEAAAPTPSPTA